MSEAVEEKSSRRRGRRNQDEENNEEETGERGLTAPKGRATRGRRSGGGSSGGKEDGGGNFITKSFRGVREYIGGVQDELDKVVWPTREELIRLTRIVLMVTIASAIALGIISFIFTEMFVIGLRDNNPLIFVGFFVVVGIGYVAVGRLLRNNQSPY